MAIRDAEEGLLHLKRARLLREVDSVVQISEFTGEDEVKVEPLDPIKTDAEPLEGQQIFGVGSKCRFRHSDGRWYNGQIVGFDGCSYAKISFLTPTSENMLVCSSSAFHFIDYGLLFLGKIFNISPYYLLMILFGHGSDVCWGC